MAAAYMKQPSKFCVKNRLLTLFRSSSFQALGINEALVNRLTKLGINRPTGIQENAIPAVVQRTNAIINAETGSGKTLCYLLPIVNELISKPSLLTKPPYAIILLPTIELCHQVASVFRSIADPDMFPCIVNRDSKLLVARSHPVVLAMPSALLNYNLDTLSNTRMIVTDEADFLTTSGGKDVWTLLNFFKIGRQMKKKRKYGNSNRRNTVHELSKGSHTISNVITERQFVFVAATLPSRGKKASLNVLTKWLPKAQLVNTSLVHQKLPDLKVEYVKVTEETKLQQLLKLLNELTGLIKLGINNTEKEGVSCQNDKEDLNRTSEEELTGEEITLKGKNNALRVLVFANTAEKASLAFKYLTDKNSLEVQNAWMEPDCDLLNDNNRLQQLSNDMITVESRKYWQKHCAELHKGVPIEKRLKSLESFKSGKLQVLVCTDIASRGLDIPDVSHVIQLDFASNAAIFLHRAGRTARAGTFGKVINFITPKDEDLARAIQACDEDTNKPDYGATFSRNRMFRRRIKAKSLPLAEAI